MSLLRLAASRFSGISGEFERVCKMSFICMRLGEEIPTRPLQRFLSTGKFSTDLSLLNRYSEWKSAWLGTLHAPILGNGFGSSFRYYQIISGFHQWSGYSHSSYLYILFKTGFIGGLLFFGAY